MARAGRVVLVKLGGSLITDKRRREAYRPRVVARLAREVAHALPGVGGRLVLGHGAGSFGHAAARRHGVGSGPVAPDGAAGIADVQDRTARLHRRVIESLLRAGVPAFSQSPSSLAVARDGRVGSFAVDGLRAALDVGLVPVVHGDVVLDRSWRASICSTEEAFLAIARRLRRAGAAPSLALWLGVTDGVLDDRGRTIPRIPAGEAFAALAHAGGSHGEDVTGGMAHRLRSAVALARIGVPSWIGDGSVPGRLLSALSGRFESGTRVEPG